MRSTFTRSPDKLFLLHHVLFRLRGRGFFSAYQAARATYFGDGKVHPQQRRRVKNILESYVKAGILERDDTIAACPLYRHRDVNIEDVDQEMVDEFEKHAASRRLTPCYKTTLMMLDHHLDQLVPKDANPDLYNEYGHLVDREWQALRERAIQRPARPRVLGYLGISRK